MRSIIDSMVKKYYDGKVFEQDEYQRLCGMYPGKTIQSNAFNFAKSSQIPKDDLMDTIENMITTSTATELKDRFGLCMLQLIPLDSVYISLAAQQCLYKVCTKEVAPQTLQDMVKTASKERHLESVDLSYAQKLADDFWKLYLKLNKESSESKKDNLLELAQGIK